MVKPHTMRHQSRHHAGMNRLESDYAVVLEAQRLNGTIRAWHYESLKFRLADKTWYSPDFVVIAEDGTIELHETKGFMRDDANVKLKVTSHLYWEYTVKLVKRAGRGWSITAIES
jgi:hypothetical protein